MVYPHIMDYISAIVSVSVVCSLLYDCIEAPVNYNLVTVMFTGIVGATCISVHMHMCHKSRNRKREQVVHRVKTSSDLLALIVPKVRKSKITNSVLVIYRLFFVFIRVPSAHRLRPCHLQAPFPSGTAKKRPVTAPTERTAFSSRALDF